MCQEPAAKRVKPSVPKRPNPAAQRLRSLLAQPGVCHQVPCCYDGLSAKLISRAGFDISFMSGFSVAGSHGLPDTQLLSYADMVGALGTIVDASPAGFPVVGDGDNGYGNAVNTKRTVQGYAKAGAAMIMVEDQVLPKRCGHTKGKAVVGFDEAVARVRAACDARDEGGYDILVLARTDARGTHDMAEALRRCAAFRAAGADATFLEAPLSVAEMREYCAAIDGPKMANMLEGGKTPLLRPEELREIGYSFAVYPLTLLSSAIKAMEAALALLKEGQSAEPLLCPFEHVKDTVGFPEYVRHVCSLLTTDLLVLSRSYTYS